MIRAYPPIISTPSGKFRTASAQVFYPPFQKQKLFLGNEHPDFDLVVALDNGYPCESGLLEESFKKLKEKAGLLNVVFHSLRHSFTTYKLMLSKGDIKSVQGDTGHAKADMVTRFLPMF